MYEMLYGETRDELRELASALHAEMERLDPGAGPQEFSDLDGADQIFYICCAQEIFRVIKSRSKISPTTAS